MRILYGRTGCSVATIAEEVNIGVWDTEFFSSFEEGEEVVYVRMDTAIRDLYGDDGDEDNR